MMYVCSNLNALVHGQGTCDESFSSKVSQIIDRFGKMGLIYCGFFGLNTFCHCVSLLHNFSLIYHYSIISKKQKDCKTFARNIYLELGYEFGLQRFRDLEYRGSLPYADYGT